MTPADEMRAATVRLRDDRNCNNYRVDSGSSELLDMIRVLLRAREALATWLERSARRYDAGVTAATEIWGSATDAAAVAFLTEGAGNENDALGVARAINAESVPGHVQAGAITDHCDPRSVLRLLQKES